MTGPCREGVGIGLRRPFLDELLHGPAETAPDFIELAPENWMGLGGRYAEALAAIAKRFPVVCHGLNLSLGGLDPLDKDYLNDLKAFIRQTGAVCYSDHLSYSSHHGHLYDLLPLAFTPESARHVAGRILQVQDSLGQRIAIENISYYAATCDEMTEADFIREVLRLADCDLLLDVNNVAVNAFNHGYDPLAFMRAMPTGRIRYLHVAGHKEEAGLRMDTHGAPVSDEVWALLAAVYAFHGDKPTLLERDFNLPPLSDLLQEVRRVRDIRRAAGARRAA